MKVRCTNLVDRNTGGSVDRDDWLTVGEIYTVIFTEKPKGGDVLFRIVSNDDSKQPMLFESSFFEILGEVDSSWVSETSTSGTLRTGPKQFMAPGFWANLFDGEIQEKRVFEEVIALLS